LKTARELGVEVVAYAQLGKTSSQEWLRAETISERKICAKISPILGGNFGGNLKLVEGLALVAKENGCTPGQLALAWILAQGDGK
jgi:aryl-alcohol dehydrogenase-like predicted oxidoreductase